MFSALWGIWGVPDNKGGSMTWWQIVLAAWGTTSVALFAVMGASFRAGAGYDTWMHGAIARSRSDSLLGEAA